MNTLCLRRFVAYMVRNKWFVFVECCKLWIRLLGILHDLGDITVIVGHQLDAGLNIHGIQIHGCLMTTLRGQMTAIGGQRVRLRHEIQRNQLAEKRPARLVGRIEGTK